MRAAQWQDYELLDTLDGERLERWGDVLLIRPDPQILWSGEKKDPRWGQAHARYQRSSSGGGKWQNYKKVPPVWKIHWNGLTFRLKTMGFKHTGIFPEQAVNWEFAMEKIRQAGRPPEDPVRVLNLFGYTGAATLACMKAGAMVTHVDASKGMVQWARENAEASGRTTASSWTRPPMAGALAARCGSWRSSCTASSASACPSLRRSRCFSSSTLTPQGFPPR